MTGSPTDVGPGWICRVRLSGGLGYSTPRCTREEAEAGARNIEALIAAAGDSCFIWFYSDAGRVRLRADRVCAIEPLPVQVPVRRFAPAPEPAYPLVRR